MMEGAWLWELKDLIDRKWMWNYTGGLPIMSPVSLPSPIQPHTAVAIHTQPPLWCSDNYSVHSQAPLLCVLLCIDCALTVFQEEAEISDVAASSVDAEALAALKKVTACVSL